MHKKNFKCTFCNTENNVISRIGSPSIEIHRAKQKAELIQPYLHYILNEDEKSLVYQFLQIQLQNPSKKDWGTQIKTDIEDLNMGTEIEEIKDMPKATLKKLVKAKVNENAFKYLMSKKKSKTINVPHTNLEMQEYLEANDGEITLAEKQFIFQCRSRMLEVKCKMKNENLKDLKCSACGKEDESQMHLMQCQNLNHDNIEEAQEIRYSDLFSSDILKMKVVGNILKSKMKQMFDSFKLKRIPRIKEKTRRKNIRKPNTIKTKPKIRNKKKIYKK